MLKLHFHHIQTKKLKTKLCGDIFKHKNVFQEIESVEQYLQKENKNKCFLLQSKT